MPLMAVPLFLLEAMARPVPVVRLAQQALPALADLLAQVEQVEPMVRSPELMVEAAELYL